MDPTKIAVNKGYIQACSKDIPNISSIIIIIIIDNKEALANTNLVTIVNLLVVATIVLPVDLHPFLLFVILLQMELLVLVTHLFSHLPNLVEFLKIPFKVEVKMVVKIRAL